MVDESVMMYNEIVNVPNIPTNVTSTVSINSEDKKVSCKMDYYILHMVF